MQNYGKRDTSSRSILQLVILIALIEGVKNAVGVHDSLHHVLKKEQASSVF
jgi:hypothetical protein